MKPIKNNHNIFLYPLLGTITFGIYAVWYLHCLAKDVNVLCRDTNRKTTGVLALYLLSLVTCGGYAVFWWFRVADMLSRQIRIRGLNSDISGGFVMLSFVLGYFLTPVASWVGVYKVFEALNELADDYNANILPVMSADAAASDA
jgi:hypothetical protein